ncbi:MAG: hypothetical protein FWF96_03450 [Kiritimatiellaeota bacterium]|nr:hypothetical protein [Kiritimatiellota bacterium]
MNPILLKELRQGIRNRFVLGAYLLYILALLLATGMYLAKAYGDLNFDGMGRTLFQMVFALNGFVLCVFIPVQTLVRLSRERWVANPDLQFVAPLPASAFALGKLGSGAALAGLFTSAAAPFCFLSYFLGGVDIPGLAVSFLLLALIFILALSAFILLGIAPLPGKFGRAAIQLLATGLLVVGFALMVVHDSLVFEAGEVPLFFERDRLPRTLSLLFAGLSVWAVFFTGAIAGFRAPGSNRMRPFRVTVTALWALWPAWFWVWSRIDGVPGFLHMLHEWSVPAVLFASLLLVFASGERADFSPRQLEDAPRTIAGRLFAWLFGNGQMSGMAWSLLLMGAALLMGTAKFWWPGHGHGVLTYHTTPLTMAAYALTSTLAWRFFLKGKYSNASLWIFTMAAAFIISIILSALTAVEVLPDPCLGTLFVDNTLDTLFPHSVFWSMLLLIAFIPLVVQDFVRFKKRA